MKKMFLTIIVAFLMISNLSAVDFSNREMIIRMNGHDHYVHDFISDTLSKAYTELAGDIRQSIIDELDDVSGISGISVGQPSISEITFHHLTTGTGEVKVKIPNWNVGFTYQGCPYDCSFDVTLSAKIKAEIDTSSYYLVLYDIEPYAVINIGWDLVWYEIWKKINCTAQGYIAFIVLSFMENFGFLEPFEYAIDDYKHELFAISELPGSLTDPDIVQEMINSFPISFSFDYYNETDKNLLINMDFMEGTESNPSAFQGIEPDPVQVESFDHIGFATFNNFFENGFSNWNTLPPEIDTPIEKANFLIDKMEEMHTQSVKLEISWKDVMTGLTSADVNCGLDPNYLDTPEGDLIIDNFVENGEWGVMDEIINTTLERGIDVILQMGHQRVLVNGLPMVPSSVPLNPPDNVYYVDEDTYLYYLKLFAKAAVRRYANDIAIWHPENEINTAKFTYLCGWWRDGDLWADDGENGFVDKVWNVLINAINDEDPTAKIIHNFHMLNLVEGIQRFGEDLDIIGLDLYPNQFFARPILGFALGELIWATRRALKGLGWNDKEVWITETNYPGEEQDKSTVGINLAEDLKYFSYSRQAQYITEATQSALDNGAKGFFWYSLWLLDETKDLEPHTYYGSLLPYHSLELKQPAANSFNTETLAKHPGKCAVQLTNKNLQTGLNIGGKISLADERDSLPSGETVYAIRARNHASRTDQRELTGLIHNKWNTEKEYKLTESFYIENNVTEYYRDAYFKPTNTVTISSSIPGVSIEFRDPWYYDEETRTQPDCFLPISPGQYQVFLKQNESFNPAYPIYRLKAPHIGQVTSSDIMVFDHWESPSATVAVFNAQGATTTTNRETPVVFKQGGATVTAVYTQVNQIDAYHLSIPSDETLTIPAGAEIDFAEGFKFIIQGYFEAIGTTSEPIIFNAIDTTKPWDGFLLDLYNSNTQSKIQLTHCTFKNTKNVICIHHDPYNIKSSIIEMVNCVVTDLQCTSDLIDLNDIVDYSNNGFIIWSSEQCFYSYRDNVHITIDKCTFNNGKYLLYGTSESSTDYINVSNTIFNNCPIYIYDSYILHYYNNDFYDCTFYEEDVADMNLYQGTDEDNIEADPKFVDVANGDFYLQSTSPCIDAGDPGLESDPDGTAPDIGAFYYHQPPATPTGFNGVWYNNHPKVYWNAVDESDLQHYEVWKKKGSGAWILRTTTTATNYTDNSEFKWTKPQPGYTVYYKVRAVDDLDYTSNYTSAESFSCNAPQSDKDEYFPVVEIDPIPTEFCLHAVYPNPFNITTTLKLDLPEETRFSLVIYDIQGTEIWRLNNRRTNTWPAGYHRIVWDGRDNSGAVVPTGVYFIVYHSAERKLTQKLVLMK